MIKDTDKLLKFITQVEDISKKPEKLLTVQNEQAKQVRNLTRDLYNLSKKTESKKLKSKEALESLEIANLDEEQIWQQIDLQNNSICNSLVSNIAHLLAQTPKLKFPLKEKKSKKNELKDEDKSDDDDDDNEEEEEKEDIGYRADDNSDESDDDHKMKKQSQKKDKPKPTKSSVVDDKFFKLHEMEEFLEAVENDNGNDRDEDDELIDYFEDDEDDDSKNQMHYNDFFDEPGEETMFGNQKRKESGSDMDAERKTKKVKFSIEEEEDEDGSSGADEEEEDFSGLDDLDEESEGKEAESDSDENNEDNRLQKQNQQPSSFEARQERLRSKIDALEEEALKEKPWQLKGEVTATSRPQNSLLQEYVEFDVATRPAPVLTEKSTLKLEDIIIQRIKDKAWDDVVRKVKPVESELEYKKKLVLDHEKSKLSLAQIYEKEYLKQLDNQNLESTEKPEVEPPEYQVIRNMMKKLFTKLDALSNFHFTPKQAEPEVKIINNLPAITMEEVAPVATSDATLLAPEEVKGKTKGDLKGKTERTATDKKRERRKKKILQRIKFQKLEAKAKAQLEKQQNIKEKLPQKVLQKITKSRNVTQLKESEGGKYLKSSNAFFSKLQDKTHSKIQRKDSGIKNVNLGKKIKKSGKAR